MQRASDPVPQSSARFRAPARGFVQVTLIANDYVTLLDGVFQNPLQLVVAGMDNRNDSLTVDVVGDSFGADATSLAEGGGIGVDAGVSMGGQLSSSIRRSTM